MLAQQKLKQQSIDNIEAKSSIKGGESSPNRSIAIGHNSSIQSNGSRRLYSLPSENSFSKATRDNSINLMLGKKKVLLIDQSGVENGSCK